MIALINTTSFPSTQSAWCRPANKRSSCDLAGPDIPLIKLSEQAAHEFIRIRKEAIDEAAEMLKQNEHREEVLSILEYLAKNGHFTSLSLNQKRRIK